MYILYWKGEKMVPGIGRQMSRNQMAHSMSRGHKKCLRMELMPKKSKKGKSLFFRIKPA